MKEFGWTIEYTLSRTHPAFMHLTRLIDRLRADSAIDGTYAGYIAGKYGGKITDKLFEKRGSFHIKNNSKPIVTQEDIDRAVRKAQEIAERAKKDV